MSENGEESVYQHKRNGSIETNCQESDAEDLKSYTSLANETDSGVSNTGSIDSEGIPHVTMNGMALIDEDDTANDADGRQSPQNRTTELSSVTSSKTGKISFMRVCPNAALRLYFITVRPKA